MSNETRPAGYGGRPPFYKRQYIVDKPFQYRLIGTLLCIWAANTIFFTMVLYLLYDGHLNRFYDLVPREGLLPLLSLPTLFAVSILFVSLFGVIVLGIIALYMSNQIAGPLYRTKKSLERLGQGDLAFKLRFRHGDFLNDFPEIFNAMLERLRRQSTEELDALRAIEASVSDAGEVAARVKKLREMKEIQLGVSSGTVESQDEEREPVSLAVH
jgi:methyl-accepting chemotaxis protein